MGRSLVVFPEQIFAKISVKGAPDGVDVIGIVLRVVVFKQKVGSLDSIVMSVTRLRPASPGKCHPRAIDGRRTLSNLVQDRLAILGRKLLYHSQQLRLLLAVQLIKRDPLRRFEFSFLDLPLGGSDNFTRRGGRNDG